MKKNRQTKSLYLSNSRWAAYAAAGAATAFAGSHTAEAAIHYSGILNLPFPPHKDTARTFPLDQAGDVISFERAEVGTPFFGGTDIAYFRIFAIAAASFRGFRSVTADYRHYVSRLPFGRNVSDGPFTFQPPNPGDGGIMVSGHFPFGSQEWKDRGTGYVGFRFDNGAGLQYGWARVRISGLPENSFRVVDYAFADVGEPIRTGQKSSNEMLPEEGSLGWLAVGAAGLLAWRKRRAQRTPHGP
jgi:hypothetical protein